mmetsp:Transcript_59232/g.108557  ORF Transcript_59232/g.108557 Transcript_59232/m.108557 type:complete len:322 (+) Transcript_59232:56-1021(+)
MSIICLLLLLGLVLLIVYFCVLPIYDSVLSVSNERASFEDELSQDPAQVAEKRRNQTKSELDALRRKFQELTHEKRRAFEEDDLDRAFNQKRQAEEVALEISKLEGTLLQQLQQETVLENEEENNMGHRVESRCYGVIRSFDISCRQIGSVAGCMDQMVCQWADAQTESCHPASDDLWLRAECAKLNRTACDHQIACTWANFDELYRTPVSQTFIFHQLGSPQTSSVLWFFIAFSAAFFDIAFRPFSRVRPNRDMCDKYLDACAGMCLMFLGVFGGLFVGIAVSMGAMICNFFNLTAVAGNTACSLITVAIIYCCECSFQA